jgi:hypothetical protein
LKQRERAASLRASFAPTPDKGPSFPLESRCFARARKPGKCMKGEPESAPTRLWSEGAAVAALSDAVKLCSLQVRLRRALNEIQQLRMSIIPTADRKERLMLNITSARVR